MESPKFDNPPTKHEENAVNAWASALRIAAHHERRALSAWRVERVPGGKFVLVVE